MLITEDRLQTPDNMVNNAVITDEDHYGAESTVVGAKMTIRNQDGKPYQHTTTGSTEADPSRGKISNVCPIGRSLLAKKIGDVTEVNAPSGKIKLEILAID